MYIHLVDTHRKSLMPLSLTRPVSHLHIGVDRIIDKWKRHSSNDVGVVTATYLSAIRDERPTHGEHFAVSAATLPTTELLTAMADLKTGDVLVKNGYPVAARFDFDNVVEWRRKIDAEENLKPADFGPREIEYHAELHIVRGLSDIFAFNDAVLRRDFSEIVESAVSSDLPHGVVARGKDIFIAPGATLHPCILNAETGPIYIGPGAEIMEGAMIRGPFYLGDSAVVKMGAKIYGATSIARECRAGGELNNVVMHPYSNKGHDGFLGNSVLGSWCNLGADTNTSNLKNNYGTVRVWSYESDSFEDSGRQFHGLVMGDHAKTGINTMLNTGTVVGVATNVFGAAFPPKFLPSFRWGPVDGRFEIHQLPKAMQTARTMMERRRVEFTERDEEIFQVVAARDRVYGF